MKIKEFKIERYFAKYESKVRYNLSPSDCESLSSKDLLAIADQKSLELWNNLKLQYTESQGHPLLRTEISKIYKGIKEDNIVVATPEECIFVVMNTLLKGGKFMNLAKITMKGQITIPMEVRKKLGVREGDKVVFLEQDGRMYCENSARKY